ncbi:hypothetical protein [Pseudomonas simiae]|uniref:hypothetical protein n=1 Tax=Pseudomonas simiae TaxID=321846 RepID=UPI001F35772F|nr:hypothetical protein [Pseudomonas simiae]
MIGIIKQTERNSLSESLTDHKLTDLSTDIDFFNAAVTASSFSKHATGSTVPQNLLSEAARKLSSVTYRMTRSLRALSSPNKLDEARKYPGQLSDALLLQQMLSKSVGKTAQCIDKISSLQ